MTDHKIVDGGSLRRYFTQIPNLVDDTEMSVYAFRLYFHMKRVAGDSGKCYQSTRTLSKACNMGVASISRAKQELLNLKLITIAEKPTKHGGKDYHEIRVTDIWDKNFKSYTSSPQELASSHQEQPSSPGEIKKNSINKNPIKKKEDNGKELPPPTPKRKKKRDERLDHPVIIAYREEARLHVPITWRDKVITIIDNPHKWQALIHDWVGLGFNPKNIKGMLDAYKKGGIEQRYQEPQPLEKSHPVWQVGDPLPGQ